MQKEVPQPERVQHYPAQINHED